MTGRFSRGPVSHFSETAKSGAPPGKKDSDTGADPHKLRLSTLYYISRADIDRFLDAFDEYKQSKA
jgi:selenocysteine lyase/cysteine desulfurase